MKTECKVAGITFRVKGNEELRKFVPEGACELRHVPFVHPSDSNRNDPNAVEVWNKGLMLGFLGKGSNERKSFFEAKSNGADVLCKVVDFSYSLYDANLNIIDGEFNDQLDGYLASVIIEFESSVTSTHYTIKEKAYVRVTKIAGLIDEIGFILPKHLYNWMTAKQMDTRSEDVKKGWPWFVSASPDRVAVDRVPMTHEEYIAKIENIRLHGIRLHDACEEFVRDGTTNDDTPHGLKEFVAKHQVKYLSSEQVVKRGRKYRVAGRYDLLATGVHKDGAVKVVVDWKRGGSLKIAHMLQCAFYARQLKADEFWVVLFGTKNKCGYSVKRFVKEDIDILCIVFDMLTKIAYTLTTFPQFKAFK